MFRSIVDSLVEVPSIEREFQILGMSGAANNSRVWSCSTLRDGVDYLLEQSKQVEEEEASLMKLIEDIYSYICSSTVYMGLIMFCMSEWYPILSSPKGPTAISTRTFRT